MTITENDLLAELAAEYRAGERQPGDVDKRMLAAATGLSEVQAAKRLRAKALAGVLVEVRVFEAGKWLFVYRRAR